MANTISHYQVLTDNNVINLNLSGDKEEIFWNPPGDIRLDGGPGGRPMLSFNVDADDANNIKLEVWTRDDAGAKRNIDNGAWVFAGNATHQIMEPFPSEWVRSNGNSFTFEKISGTGQRLQIRNVVIFCHRLILT